jgi:hypothetical protein
VLLLLALVAFFLRGGLLGGVFYKRDLHLLWHAQVEGFVRTVMAGSFPLWDPAPAFGQPLLADGLAQALYPMTWLNLLMRPWTYYTLYASAHLLLASVGMLALAHRLGLSRAGSIVAAAVWTASGPLVSLLDLWHHLAGAAWMPWILVAADTAVGSGRAIHALRWGALVGVQVLAGSTDMCAATALVTLALVAARVEWRPSPARALLRAGRTAAVAALFALALSAALWLPALDLASRSNRSALPEAARTYWSVHPALLAQTLLAHLWTNVPLRSDVRAALLENREPLFASLYLGLPVLALVGAALAKQRTRLTAALLVILVGSVLVALGRHAPFYDALTFLLPPLRMLRFPVKAMVPAALAWSLLAAVGFEAWRKKEAVRGRSWSLAVLAPLALVLAGAATAWSALTFWPDRIAGVLLPPDASAAAAAVLRSPASTLAVQVGLAALALAAGLWRLRVLHYAGATAVGLAALGILDLAAAHRNIQPAARPAFYTHRPDVVQALERLPHARLYAYDYTRPEARAHLGGRVGLPLARIPAGWDADAAWALALQMHLAPATAGRWGLPTGFDIDYRGLYAHDLAQLTLLLRALEGTPAHTRLLRLGGVSHVVALHAEGWGDLRPVARFEGLYAEPVRLFAVPDPLPRTYAVGTARVASGIAALRTLASDDFDPARQVVLPEGPALGAPSSFHGASRVLSAAPDRVRLEATLSAPGYVVLLDGYDVGWKAWVDGRRAPVARANVAFRAVAVPAGTHVIEYRYRPWAVTAGAPVSAAALLVGLGAAGTRLARGTRARGARS